MMRYTSVVWSISIMLLMFNLIQSSSKNRQRSKELSSYDEEFLDKTIDVSDKDDSSQESLLESFEDVNNKRKHSAGTQNI